MNNERATFFIKYEGPILEDNEMDIKELAPALLAVADLFEEANSVLNKGTAKITVGVKGSFKSGSFGIDFSVVQDIYQHIINFINQEEVITALLILQILGLDVLSVGKGLIPLLKKIGRRKITAIKNENEREVSIILTNEDGNLEEITTQRNVFLLFKNIRIRNSIEKIISEPLSKEGIDKFIIVDKTKQESLVISKEEKDYFVAPNVSDEFLGETVTDAFLQIVNLAFRNENKWRFSRGENTFYASIEDQEFLNRVENNERFSKNDILQVRLRLREYLSDNGIRIDYCIEKVLDHRSAARQLSLPFDNGMKDTSG
jgi:hypothetical protein